jgi:ankyrin repeat protein
LKLDDHQNALECSRVLLKAAALLKDGAQATKDVTALLNTVSSDDNNRRTALHLAVIAGNEELVQFLLENEADLLLSDKYSYTALHLAVQNGKL